MNHKWKIEPRGKITKYYICQRCGLRVSGKSKYEVNRAWGVCSKPLTQASAEGMELSLPDSQKGSSKPCPECRGSGLETPPELNFYRDDCPKCKGTGKASGN